MSSLDNLLTKIRSLAARPSTEFSRFDALDLIQAIKNVAQDSQHAKANYYRIAYETLRSRINDCSDEQFRAYLLPLLGDQDQGKILDIMAKVEKRNKHGERRTQRTPRDSSTPYRVIRCYYCNRFGHFRTNCFKWKRDHQASKTNNINTS